MDGSLLIGASRLSAAFFVVQHLLLLHALPVMILHALPFACDELDSFA
jgi:hypothetical protein